MPRKRKRRGQRTKCHKNHISNKQVQKITVPEAIKLVNEVHDEKSFIGSPILENGVDGGGYFSNHVRNNTVGTLEDANITCRLTNERQRFYTMHWMHLVLETTGVGNCQEIASWIWVQLWNKYGNTRNYSFIINKKEVQEHGVVETHSFVVANLDKYTDKFKKIHKWNKNAIILDGLDKMVDTVENITSTRDSNKYRRYIKGWYPQIIDVPIPTDYKFNFQMNKKIFTQAYIDHLNDLPFPIMERAQKIYNPSIEDGKMMLKPKFLLDDFKHYFDYQINTLFALDHLVKHFVEKLKQAKAAQREVCVLHLNTFCPHIPTDTLRVYLFDLCTCPPAIAHLLLAKKYLQLNTSRLALLELKKAEQYNRCKNTKVKEYVQHKIKLLRLSCQENLGNNTAEHKEQDPEESKEEQKTAPANDYQVSPASCSYCRYM